MALTSKVMEGIGGAINKWLHSEPMEGRLENFIESQIRAAIREFVGMIVCVDFIWDCECPSCVEIKQALAAFGIEDK
jgi:hypothetical protein